MERLFSNHALLANPSKLQVANRVFKRQSRPSPPPDDIFTYRRLRRMIGLLGILLPLVLVFLSLWVYPQMGIKGSISAYYYTQLRELFTGTLCSVGLFLICYKGHGNRSLFRNDNFLTNLCGIMAFGVALFPMAPSSKGDKVFTLISSTSDWLGWLHYGFAAVLFLSFSILSIKVFTLGQHQDATLKKSFFNENNIYRFCGYSILLFMSLIPVCMVTKLFVDSTLLFEALSLFAFGMAWLIKGRILGDKGKVGEKIYQEKNFKGEINGAFQ